MRIRELAIGGAYEITPVQHRDDRGVFLEWFKDPILAETIGHRFDLRQANCSVSSAGALRGIHFADVPTGQAKYVTCIAGSAFDVVVDIRVGSPTFGNWDAVLLDTCDRRAMYVPEGLGHAFLALEDNATVVYLCSSGYVPEREHGISPVDPMLAIDWPAAGVDGRPLSLLISDKDRTAPSLMEAKGAGLLPDFASVQSYLRELNG